MTVELRPITLEDTDNIIKWRNASDVKHFLFSQKNITKKQHVQYFNNSIKTGKVVQFIIVSDGIDCGTAFLKNIDPFLKEAEYGIFIGIPSFRGKGLSTIVTKRIIDYGFSFLGLKRIYLSVFKDNISAIKSYKKAGFIEQRIIEKGYKRVNVYYDIVEMSIFSTNIFA